MGEHRWRRQRNQGPLPPTEEIAPVVRGVVGAATRRDHETAWPLLCECFGDGLERRPALRQLARRDVRLLADLLAEAAHLLYLTRPPTHVWRTCRSPSSTTRSAHAPSPMRPSLRSPSTRAGTDEAIAMA